LEHHGGGGAVMLRCCGELWYEGGGNIWVLEILLLHISQLLGISDNVDGFDGIRTGILDVLSPAFMGDEDGADCLGVSIDKEAELGEDGEPDVVGAQPEVQVLLPGAYDGVGEAIFVWYDRVVTIWKTER
jgi:hypothetical protein